MSHVKPVKFTIEQNQVDSAGKVLQLMDLAHRVSLMSTVEGRDHTSPAHFGGPLGVGTYYGFGADGWHYEAGVQIRTFTEKESIDDFADLVTDTERWETAGVDFDEGGINYIVDTPFGKRLYCTYGGAGVEEYDRKGKMSVSPAADPLILSSRVTTVGEGAALGASLEFVVCTGIQLIGDDTTYVFAGYINTAANPFSVVMGHFAGGVPTISSVTALTSGMEEVDVAIYIDPGGATYRGYFSEDLTGEDYDGASWAAIGIAAALPGGWAGDVVPRLHASFPAGAPEGLRQSIADVRVEKDSDTWTGQQRASWYLEASDGGNPATLFGSIAECPDKLMVVWERDAENNMDLTLIDVADPDDPLLWRRWRTLPPYHDDPFPDAEGVPFWSPGWMDADEGHIVMTRNSLGTGSSDEKGEVWLYSLRWDTVLVFTTEGLFRYPLLSDTATGRILRESGTWGARRWFPPTPNIPVIHDNYDHTRQPATSFFGTLAKIGTEAEQAAITYGTHIRRESDGVVYLAYGIQYASPILPSSSPTYAGLIILEEGPSKAYDRWIFQHSGVGVTLWDGTDECWVGVALSSDLALWWTQPLESALQQEIMGVVCRRDFSGDAANNLVGAPYAQDSEYGGLDRVGASCLNLSIIDSDPVGDEILFVASGWAGDSWLTGIWYDGGTPADTQLFTYGYTTSSRAAIPISSDFQMVPPSEEFPKWMLHHTEITNSKVDACRISNARHRTKTGVPSVLAPTALLPSITSIPAWVGYGKWEGTSTVSYRHALLRGSVIGRNDFVLHMSGVYSPPFNAGLKMITHQYLKSGQAFAIRLYLRGERRFYSYVEFSLVGVGGGIPATVVANASYTYQKTGASQVTASSSLSLGGWALVPEVDLRFRVRRIGNNLQLLLFDPSLGSYQLVMERTDMLTSPLQCGMEVRLEDKAAGIAASTSFEIDQFVLAPYDDFIGAEFVRPTDFAVLSSVGASVAGGGINRLAMPTGVVGNVAVAEGWLFPGFTPY